MSESSLGSATSDSRQKKDAVITTPVRHTGRKGFLPFETNLWDRFFIGGVILVAIHLLWLRFVEPLFLPTYTLWGAMAISLVIMYIIVRWG
jgi:predicted small integral membrane protein